MALVFHDKDSNQMQLVDHTNHVYIAITNINGEGSTAIELSNDAIPELVDWLISQDDRRNPLSTILCEESENG